MDISNSKKISCKVQVKRCFNCQGHTAYYCHSCKRDLCCLCKNEHYLMKDTYSHYLTLYRERYQYPLQDYTCAKHGGHTNDTNKDIKPAYEEDFKYDVYCRNCEVPICFHCSDHRHHRTADIKLAHKEKIQENREHIHNIIVEITFSLRVLHNKLRSKVKTCHSQLLEIRSKMFSKAQDMKKISDNILSKYKCTYLKQKIRMVQQEMKISEESLNCNRPVQFLRFVKKNFLFNQNGNADDVIKLLNEFEIKENLEKKLRKKLMAPPVLEKGHIFQIIKEIKTCSHISSATGNQLWYSNEGQLVCANKQYYTIEYCLTDLCRNSSGSHTLNNECEIIYIDEEYNIVKRNNDLKQRAILMRKLDSLWEPMCLFFSPSTKDLLIGLSRHDTCSGKVVRCDSIGDIKQSFDNTDSIYIRPLYITENTNGDVIVSDHGCRAVVVTEHGGRYRFSYKGPPSGSEILPCGVCTDALSHILICDINSNTVQMIDSDGQFLSYLLIRETIKIRPISLSYDVRSNLLFFGTKDQGIFVYRYLIQQNPSRGKMLLF